MNEMRDDFQLLPFPQIVTMRGGNYKLSSGQVIAISGVNIQNNLNTGERLQKQIFLSTGAKLDIVAGTTLPKDVGRVSLSLIPNSTRHTQGYRLTISESGIFLIASTSAGLFYGVNTLIQVIEHYGRDVHGMKIVDWPDYPVRGVMLDISRNKVPRMDTLYKLVELLAFWKINQLQLYTEHTFAYRNHPVVWADASPMTGEEILLLDRFCAERFIDLVPNQNSFGHLYHWLKHREYNHLAECPEGCDTEWGYLDRPFSLCPEDPGSLDLLRTIYDELLPHFDSRFFNIGCDETVDVGRGRSAKLVQEQGAGRVYIDFLNKLINEVAARKRTAMFWGDIVVKHPEWVKELPRDVVALEWGYESNHPFDEHGQIFHRSGVPYYVCPGTSSWNSVAGRTSNALENLRSAARFGLKHGAVGLLNTDWGDNGHWQPLSVSFVAFAAGAALSWAEQANENLNILRAISKVAFDDESGQLGSIAHDLGNVYLKTGALLENETVLFRLLQTPPAELPEIRKKLTSGDFNADSLFATQNLIAEIVHRLPKSVQNNDKLELNVRELRWVADVLSHACRRGIWMIGLEAGRKDEGITVELAREAEQIINEFGYLWHARNRSGGFADSLALFERMQADYEMVEQEQTAVNG